MRHITDPVDRIIVEQATALLEAASADQVVVLDDRTGGLALGAAQRATTGRVRVHCDSLADERRVTAGLAAAGAPLDLHTGLDAALLRGARVVLARLPKSLAALDEIAEAVARYADPEVRLVAGGRVKHMTKGMNRTLSHHFSSVTASLGQQKSRVLLAAGPVPAGTSYPRCERHDDLDLTVCAHGAAFAGTSVDLGTRFLLSVWSPAAGGSPQIVDLGCGTGVLATVAARRLPDAGLLAVDESAAACRSAAATASRNQVAERVTVQRMHLLDGMTDASVDLVLCNPPFHRGTSRDSDVAFAMFADAGRALRPGGELWTVFNTHLPYLPALRRLVGPTRIVGQNPGYLVTRSVAAAAPPRAGS